jgi:hypothetical protein
VFNDDIRLGHPIVPPWRKSETTCEGLMRSRKAMQEGGMKSRKGWGRGGEGEGGGGRGRGRTPGILIQQTRIKLLA